MNAYPMKKLPKWTRDKIRNSDKRLIPLTGTIFARVVSWAPLMVNLFTTMYGGETEIKPSVLR